MPILCSPFRPTRATRRRLTLAAWLVVASGLPALAGPLEGQWGGSDGKGQTADFDVIGDKVMEFSIGFDYFDPENVKFSQGGNQLDFTFSGGAVSVTRVGAIAKIRVHGRHGEALAVDARKN